MTIEQEDLLSKLAIEYYKHLKDYNIQAYLYNKAKESGQETAQHWVRVEKDKCLAKMEAITELGEEYLITDFQIMKEVMVIKEGEKLGDTIFAEQLLKHEERMKELGLSE